MQAKLKEFREELRRRMHWSIPEQGQWLARVVCGFFAYHAVPTNWAALAATYAVICTYGSVRGALSNERPYRNHAPIRRQDLFVIPNRSFAVACFIPMLGDSRLRPHQ
jgi:hypothetical protein